MISKRQKLNLLQSLIAQSLENPDIQQIPKLRAILETYREVVNQGKVPIELIEEFSSQLSWFAINQKKPIPKELLEILKLIKKNK